MSSTYEPALHPVKNHQVELSKAEAGVHALAATRNDRWYPKYHIASDGGWINDPNGLCYYRGRWHVFYQLHPYGTQWGPMHWGHVSSADMVTWRREPIAMAPSLEEERNGVYSGSAVVGDDGKLRFYYTANRWVNGKDRSGGQWQVQMLAEAVDDDARELLKRGMIINCPREKVDSHFRDPKVWKQDGVWYLVHGVSSADKRGQLWLYHSQDMEEWSFDQVLFECPDEDVFMLECPDFFTLKTPDGQEKWIMVCSAMGAQPKGYMDRNASNACYMIGSWKPGERFQPETELKPLDWGQNYYAPQSFLAPDGRRIMYGWMRPFTPPIPMERDGWCGQLTLPREVFLGADGDLHTVPVEEIDHLRINDNDLGSSTLATNEERILLDDAEAEEVELTIDLKRSTAERCGLKVHATEDGSFVFVGYDDQSRRVVVDRMAVSRGDRGYRSAPLTSEELSSGKLDLHVYIDRGSIEVFINNGRQAISAYNYPSAGPRSLKLVSESGHMQLEGLQMHQIGGIGLE